MLIRRLLSEPICFSTFLSDSVSFFSVSDTWGIKTLSRKISLRVRDWLGDSFSLILLSDLSRDSGGTRILADFAYKNYLRTFILMSILSASRIISSTSKSSESEGDLKLISRSLFVIPVSRLIKFRLNLSSKVNR